ncbi:MAG: DUF5615 family PIN-like protein, partial [Planctomycetota bacterium]
QRAPDRSVWGYAIEHGFSILTKDLDFRQMSLVLGHPPKVVMLRLGNLDRDQTIGSVIDKAEEISDFLNDDVSALLILT